MTRNPDIIFITEYVKNVLYFATVRQGKVLRSTSETHFFCIDNELLYENYYSDFGPLNLACVYKYCKMLNEKLKVYLNKQIIIHYTSIEPRKKANAAYLIGCYGVLYLSLSPIQALKPLTVNNQNYRAFQDATQGEPMFTISLLDCLHGIAKAHSLKFFDFEDFNIDEYERMDKIQGGDLNWIVPGKFLAFIGPVDCKLSLYNSPDMYLNYFLENNVRIVIRLNKKMYDEYTFTNVGIKHYDLFFPDGSCPRKHILLKFLQISEEANSAIAVHCKAGLGRTGTLIGCYLIKHYRMAAREAIAWMRICRPGSVIGHQQRFLEEVEAWLIKQGNLYRKRMYQNIDKFPIHKFGIYSMAEKLHRHRPVVLSKPPSPPSAIQRLTRSELSPPRSRILKTKEAPCKTPEINQFEWYLKLSTNQQNNHSGLSSAISRPESCRGNIIGAGEPRPQKSPSRATTPKTGRCCTNINESNIKNVNTGGYSQIPAFYPHYAISRNISDARNLLMQPSHYSDKIEKQLSTAIKVTPQHSFRGSNVSPAHSSKGASPPSSSIPKTAENKDQNQPQYRRRLGRSPSPPCHPRTPEQSRATNTPTLHHNVKPKESTYNIREVLSKLKLSGLRSGSIGVASLGARRDAPIERRAPSVRSDERPLATQGDMLNSIKFQRRLRDKTLTSEKLCTKLNERKKSANQKEKCTRNEHSKSSSSKFSNNQDNCSQPDQPAGTSWDFFRTPRPCSPKGRRSPRNL